MTVDYGGACRHYIPLDDLKEMRSQGMSRAELARHFHCSEKTIQRRFKECAIPPLPLTAAPLDVVAGQRAAGKKRDDLAEEMGVCPKTISRATKKVERLMPREVQTQRVQVVRAISSIQDVAEELRHALVHAREALDMMDEAQDPNGKMRGAKTLAEVAGHVMSMYDRLMSWREVQAFQEDVMESIREEPEDVAERIFARIDHRRAARHLLAPGP